MDNEPKNNRSLKFGSPEAPVQLSLVTTDGYSLVTFGVLASLEVTAGVGYTNIIDPRAGQSAEKDRLRQEKKVIDGYDVGIFATLSLTDWPLGPEQRDRPQEIPEGVVNQSSGPHAMGYDPLDPRGPWQQPGAAGDRAGGGPGRNNDDQGGGGVRGGGAGDAGRIGGGGNLGASTITRTGTNLDGYQVTTRTTTYRSGVSFVTTMQTVSTPAGPKVVTKKVTKPAPTPKDDPKKVGPQPILPDLDGDGVEMSELSESTRFVADDSGRSKRMAWVSGGEGVLFIDADDIAAILSQREFASLKMPSPNERVRRLTLTGRAGHLTATVTESGRQRMRGGAG